MAMPQTTCNLKGCAYIERWGRLRGIWVPSRFSAGESAPINRGQSRGMSMQARQGATARQIRSSTCAEMHQLCGWILYLPRVDRPTGSEGSAVGAAALAERAKEKPQRSNAEALCLFPARETKQAPMRAPLLDRCPSFGHQSSIRRVLISQQQTMRARALKIRQLTDSDSLMLRTGWTQSPAHARLARLVGYSEHSHAGGVGLAFGLLSWAYGRGETDFDESAAAEIAAACHFDGDALALVRAFISAGHVIRVDGTTLRVDVQHSRAGAQR